MDLVSERQSDGTLYYGYDGHGSTRFLLNTSGTITDTYTYDAYGILTASTGTTANNYLYCGEQFDPDLGFYYLRARYLNPHTSRFWTMDSYQGDKQDPLSLHKYLYCHGDGVNFTDTSGHNEMGSTLGTVSGIGYLAANIGLRAAPALTRVIILVAEAETGQSLIIGGGAAITGFAAMSRVNGGIGTWTKAMSQLKGLAFGPYGYVRGLIKGTSGQANHLNQSAAYEEILEKAAGCIKLDGSAIINGTEHNQFHQVLESFWNQFRAGGPRQGQKPTNKEYLAALRNALDSVTDATTKAKKFAQQEVDAMVEFAEKEQIGYGYFDGVGGNGPRVPGSMNLSSQ